MARQIEFKRSQSPFGSAQRHDRQLARIVIRVHRLLPAIRIDDLAEVALAIQQADSKDRYAQIACGLELVARDVAEAAGVDGQRLLQHELHAEVSDGFQL